MNTKLSYSAITTYNTCGEKYRLRYKEKYKPKYFHAALAFGSAIDASLNELLLTKDLEKALSQFDKSWNFQWVNKKYVSLPKYTEIVYAESDFDNDLLLQEDLDKLEHSLLVYKEILAEKKQHGWNNLETSKKEFYNYVNWLSLYRKGQIMLRSYNQQVLPKIKNVLAVQKEKKLENEQGDVIVQYLDLIVEMNDGTIVLGDNKTSAKQYEEDSASKSPQLISYYHGSKEEYKLDAVGFFVLNKQIMKNRVKVCSVCNFDGSGARHKTCSNEIEGKRCGGVWTETVTPNCYIQIIINKVHPNSEHLVISSFNAANEGIKKEAYYKNLSACQMGPIKCDYYSLCWFNDNSDVVKDEK